MAVKVVGFDEKAKKQITCKNCGSVLEYLPIDVKYRSVRHFDETDIIKSVDCPKCMKEVKIK